jgi:signal transduction histidine kinase
MDMVYADETLIGRILFNLLTNAAKYSPAQTEIRIELDQQNGWLVLRVIDQGVGISEADLPHIFEPLYRTESALGQPGTGLGLAIVQDCVRRHRGRISVQSKVGRGTTFTVEVPYRSGSSALDAPQT